MPERLPTNEAIQLDVLAEMKWDPRVHPEEVGVSVDDGVVMLSGWIDSYAKKIAAGEAAHRVHGVKAVVNDLEVRLSGPHVRADDEIAQAIVQSLKWNAHVPDEALDVTVDDGWVMLKGELEHQYQKDEVERVVRHLIGVKGVTNQIRARPRIQPSDLRKKIEQALVRSAETDARRINIEVDGAKVALKGSVRTEAERRDAARVAWSAPGVEEVDNRIVIMPEIGQMS